MKPLVPGCLAMVIKGPHTGKTVRCQSRHDKDSFVEAPDGNTYQFKPKRTDGAFSWLVIGDLKARNPNGNKIKSGSGWGMLPEHALMRIDSEGDDELIEEFAMEECANHMEWQMAQEGVKRLW